ncbi:IucA/IucC family protein [Scopulibacillus daqui]|nr:IucA/IucC family protein [Scopulibacillus daqui]
MKTAKQMAEHATMQSFLNCYLRETNNYEELELATYRQLLTLKGSHAERLIKSSLKHQEIELLLPVRYWSLTGRHLFDFPVYYQAKGSDEPKQADYLTLAALITKELLLENNRYDSEDEFILRVILSCRNIERYIEARFDDADALQEWEMDFIDAEQSLIFGHLLHPTPKSRQGMNEQEQSIYSPELKGRFQLSYFLVHESMIKQDSSLTKKASELIKEEVRNDHSINQSFKNKYCQKDDYILLPAHPFQAKELLKREEVKDWLQKGMLKYLGSQGKYFTATSSVRTVYHEDSDFMYKFSLNLKITNSLRVNKQKELDRGVEVARLLQSDIGKQLNQRFHQFKIIPDPAYITIDSGGQESGFEVVIRENPFKANTKKNAALIGGLCQDHFLRGESRLAAVIRQLAEKEAASTETISMKWFKRYLETTLRPMMWLYLHYGIALEAHQQNAIIQLEDGYPAIFYYRDNQGYYFCESKAAKLREYFPDLNKRSQTICGDDVADERLRYYLFFNHLYGLINAFGTAGLIHEQRLLDMLREELEQIDEFWNHQSKLIHSLLNESELPCKANLLTRFNDMDELSGAMETQSIYVKIKNPLVKRAVVSGEI